MENLVGQSVDRYELVGLLGQGGMGAVFKARDVALRRDVAIKLMNPQYAQRGDFRDRFLQEARAAAKLDHPGIVKVYDFDQSEDYLYVVMEFIDGDNLRQMLRNLKAARKWVVLPEALELVRQVCLAVDYAHQEGVLHRDIKPANIMLKPKPSEALPYQPVLTDLGLAKLVEDGLRTQEGTSMGTPTYVSPEQALGRETDPRSDVYSLGILLFELSTGQLPFRVRNLTEAIHCHTKEPPPPPRSLRPDLPAALEDLILKALEKDPADRFPDAKAFGKALAEVISSMTEVTLPPSALQANASLLTQHQQSAVEERGSSMVDEFPEAPSDLAEDRVQILSPDGTSRSVAIKAGELTIGRSADNDLVLDSPSVSRHHARVNFDGIDYRVTDRDSTNGTFLAYVKLMPGLAQVWSADTPLRIGKFWLRLERAPVREPAEPSMFRSDGTMVDPSLIHSSPGVSRIGVFMEPTGVSVDPGSSATASLTILNQGTVVDHFAVSVEGLPADWLPVAPPSVRLMPDQQQQVSLTIRPPRAPASRAGSYPLTIRVASQDDPDQVVEIECTLTVAAYSQFSSELHPQRIRAGAPGRVTVRNEGNAEEIFALAWKDRADELDFQPPQANLEADAGESAVAEFRAATCQRRWIGGEKVHPFTAQVATGTGQAQTQGGEIVSKGLIPVWVLPTAMLMCVLLVVSIPILQRCVAPTPTPVPVTDTPTPTPTSTPKPIPPTDTPTPTPTATYAPNTLVTGLVENYVYGPLEGIPVWLGEGEWGCGRQDYVTETDSEGRYVFGDVRPGQYCVSVNYSGGGTNNRDYDASWAGEQSKSSSGDLTVRTLYLLRWDLEIISPEAGQTISTDVHPSQMFRWQPYPSATQYYVRIVKSPDSPEETGVREETLTDPFLGVMLSPGQYKMYVHALSGDTSFAFNMVRFSVD